MLYATNRFPGDGTTTTYELSFVGGYLDRTHVRAYIEDASLVQTPVTLTSGNFLGPFTIAGIAPIPVGSTLVIYRDTPKAPLVDFVNGSRMTEANLDTATRQGAFIAAEGADASLGNVAESASRAEAAAQTATGASTTAVSAKEQAVSASVAAAASAAAAAAHGGVKAYATHAEASIAAALLPDGADIEVSQDETRAGARTRYKVQTGALVFVVNLDQLRVDLAAPTGAGLSGYGVGTVASALDSIAIKMGYLHFLEPSGADDTAVLQAALSSKKHVALIPGRTYIAGGLTAVENGGLVCIGGRANVVVPVGETIGITIDKSNFILEGVNFDGGNYGPYNTATYVPGTRSGIVVGSPYGTGYQLQGVTVKNCDVAGFNANGVLGRETVIGFSFGKRVVFENVNAYKNNSNWLIQPRFEYATFTNCYGYEGYNGVSLVGGNNTFVACHFESNWYNCQLSAGENDTHGQFVGCSFNHANGYGLYATGVTAGEIFTACAFWYAPIRIASCVGVYIQNSQIAGNPRVEIQGGGFNSIENNYTPSGLAVTIIGECFTRFRGNRTSVSDTGITSTLGDYVAASGSSTYSYPILFNAMTEAKLPLVLSYRMNNGVYYPSASNDGGIYIPVNGRYQIDATILFNTTVAEQLTMKVVVMRGGAFGEFYIASQGAAAGWSGATVALTKRMFLQRGDVVFIYLKTITGTGVVIPSGGINITFTSAE